MSKQNKETVALYTYHWGQYGENEGKLIVETAEFIPKAKIYVNADRNGWPQRVRVSAVDRDGCWEPDRAAYPEDWFTSMNKLYYHAVLTCGDAIDRAEARVAKFQAWKKTALDLLEAQK